MNPRQMKQMMKRMGIKADDIDAELVIIHGANEEIIVEGPSVMRMVVSGQEMYQVAGGKVRVEKTEAKVEIEEEDVQLVAEQTGVSQDDARKALMEAEGDIAAAIMKLKS
ncbi:MAG: nascent polypeptide-associated complex protein [Candidatus Altiarchaeales archaeon ex4484_96]|nr:MAG: nascent polypeptide-associated complex protein [Candidatus Altiarchaeales archaeon ex4484_96]